MLGFGCAPILGAVDGKKAKRAIDCAIDYGVNHFDLARSYGFGEAEKFVGRALKDKRHQVILASKFGIRANWKAKLFRPVKPVVRFIKSQIKLTDQGAPGNQPVDNSKFKAASGLMERVPFRGENMRKSLEESLRALRTDYLDYFLIHEPMENLLYIDELCFNAGELKKEGKICGWGLAFMQNQTQFHQQYLDKFDVLQFDHSSMQNDAFEKYKLLANVIFSPLRAGLPTQTPAQKLLSVFNKFPNSVILCSMFNENHIKANAEVANNSFN